MTSPRVNDPSREDRFARYLDDWRLTPDGDPITTHSSYLLPVRRDGEPAILKVPHHPEERESIAVLPWWGGDGVARVYAYDRDAILMERLADEPSLAAIVQDGRDDDASRILCSVVAKLHGPRHGPPPAAAIPLARWFQELAPVAAQYGGLLRRASEVADELLREQRDVVVLHGDIHHGNVLFAGDRGWLAIDPKGLWGERTFDYVNILRNPDDHTALAPGRFARQVDVIAQAAGLDRIRFLQWTLAFAGLSAAWISNDGDEPALDLAIAKLASSELATELGS